MARKKAAKTLSDWDELQELIEMYAEACITDACKGGGDLASYAEIELHLEQTTIALHAHIELLRRKFEGV